MISAIIAPSPIRPLGLLAAVTLALAAVPALAQSQPEGQDAPDGQRIYASAGCSGCHGREGNGGMGPKLAGDEKLSDAAFVAHRIAFGGGSMPAFKDQLSDEEIAAVGTFIRTSFGNTFGELTIEDVQDAVAASEPSQASAPAD